MFRFMVQSDSVNHVELHDQQQSASNVPGATGQQCSICLESIDQESMVIQLSCNHTFHASCITQWLADHSTCPLCRSAPDGFHRTETLQVPVDHMIHMQSVFLTLHTTDLHHITIWHVHNSLIDILQYIKRLFPSVNSNICIKIQDHVFKTSESFNYLNQTLASFGIIGEQDAYITRF